MEYWCFNYKTILGDLSKDYKSNNDPTAYIYLANCTELAEYNISPGKCDFNSIGPIDQQVTLYLLLKQKVLIK
jgi:hypothetical protein